MPATENLIQGTGVLYRGAFGATEPNDAALGEAPGGAFTNLGFTRDGVELVVSQEFAELEVDQVADVPERRLVRRELVIRTNLAEPTLENLRASLNGGTLGDASAAGPTTYGARAFEPSTGLSRRPDYSAYIFDGIAPEGMPRRIIIRKGLQIGDVTFAYRKQDQTVYTVQLAAHFVSPQRAPFRVVDGVALPTG